MADHDLTHSMSKSVDAWHFTTFENFFPWLKTERTARNIFRTRSEANVDLFD